LTWILTLLLWLLVGIIVVWLFVLWFSVASVAMCPACGIELPRNFWGDHDDHCRCGWHA